MQVNTFITKASQIARALRTEELARPEIEKLAGEEFKQYVDSIINNNCSKPSPYSEDKEEDGNAPYLLFPEAFVEQRDTLKVIKRGDNRTLAEYDNDKKYYIEYSDQEALTIIHNTFIRNQMHKWCTQKNMKDTLSNIKDTLHCSGREIDGVPNAQYINFQNGLFDVSSMSMIEHSKEYFTLAQSPCSIDLEQKECPLWSDYVDKVTGGDDGLRALLQEAMGYCIFGQDLQLQKAFFLYSETSGTGKSTFLQVLKNLVGEKNTSSLSLEKMVSASPMLKSLIGKRLNINDELGTKYMESSTISAILSGENITFDVKYKDPITMNFNTTRFIFSTNQLPNFNAALGMDRRIAIIPFQHRFYGTEGRILDFYKKVLEEESGAILNWAIEGYKRLKDNQAFTESSASIQAASDYRDTIDSVSAYLNSHDDIAKLMHSRHDQTVQTLTAKDLYGKPEKYNNVTKERDGATGFFAFCQDQNYTQRINFPTFARRVGTHCAQDDAYEVDATSKGNQYRLTKEAYEDTDYYNNVLKSDAF